MSGAERVELGPIIVTKPPGPKSQALMEKQSKLETAWVMTPRSFPFAIESAYNAMVRDVDGNRYIDWFAGMCVFGLGHRNPAIVEAVRDQMERVWHFSDSPSDNRIEFLEKVHSVLPFGLRGSAKIVTAVTGSDATELAVRIARRVTGKHNIVAFEGAYHGALADTVNQTAGSSYFEFTGHVRQGVFRLPYPYAYRFPLPAEKGEEGKVVLRYLEHLFEDEKSGLDDVAGILVEPIQCEGGYIVPPSDFLPGLREIADKFQVPLIIDEIQTGFGRTGRFWASEITNTTPDIMCAGKAVGGGIPLSLVAYRQEYDKMLGAGFSIGTYRSHALAMAACSASIDYIQNENLLDRVQKLGVRTKREFERIADASSNIGEVRGVGFMIGNEVIESKNAKSPSKSLAAEFKNRMCESGLLMRTCGHYENVLRFMAPLTIEEVLLERGLQIYEEAVIRSN